MALNIIDRAVYRHTVTTGPKAPDRFTGGSDQPLIFVGNFLTGFTAGDVVGTFTGDLINQNRRQAGIQRRAGDQ